MLEQQRKRQCFLIRQGYLFVSYAKKNLTIEFMNSLNTSEIYHVQYKKQIPPYIQETFSNLAQLYKYICKNPHKIVKRGQNRFYVTFISFGWEAIVDLNLEKIKRPSAANLLHHRILILKDQKREMKRKQEEMKIQAEKIEEQLEEMLEKAIQYYQSSQMKLEKKKSISKQKISEKSRLQLTVRQKQKTLIEHRQKSGKYMAIDDQ